MRFYIVSFERAGEATSLGVTSAAEALRAVAYMRGQGWGLCRIERGTTAISHDELKADAEAVEVREL